MELRNQIAKSGVHVDVDARKGQDLAQIMAEIRSKYEKMAQKNQEELKTWHESQVTIHSVCNHGCCFTAHKRKSMKITILSLSQIIEVQSQVAQNTEALKGAQTEVNDLHRQIQTLEIDLESQKSLVRSPQSAHTSFTSAHAAMLHSGFTFKVISSDQMFFHPGDCLLCNCSCPQNILSNICLLLFTENISRGHTEGHRHAL